MTERLLITSGLPYANGPLHFGHLLEHVMTDLWARYQRLAGRRVLSVCGEDTHGTSIMIRARAEGRSEEQLIAEMDAAQRFAEEAPLPALGSMFEDVYHPSTPKPIPNAERLSL